MKKHTLIQGVILSTMFVIIIHIVIIPIPSATSNCKQCTSNINATIWGKFIELIELLLCATAIIITALEEKK